MMFKAFIEFERVSQRKFRFFVSNKLIDDRVLVLFVIIIKHDAVKNTVGRKQFEETVEIVFTEGVNHENSLFG